MSLWEKIRGWFCSTTILETEMGNFTPRAQQVLALARLEANRFNHDFVGTEHVLLGLIRLGQGVAVNVLQKRGLNLETVRQEVEKLLHAGFDQKQVGNIPYTPRVKAVLVFATKEARALKHTYVGTEHILLGLLNDGEGGAAKVLKGLDINVEQVRQEILKELDPNFPTTSSTDFIAQRIRSNVDGGSGIEELNFTPRARELLRLARKEADRLRHNFIGSEHLLLGLVNLGKGVAVNVLNKRGIKPEGLRAEIEKFSLPAESLTPGGMIPYTPVAIRALSQAQLEARVLNHTYIGTEHILLGLLHEEAGLATKLLAGLGVEARQVRKEILLELDPNASL